MTLNENSEFKCKFGIMINSLNSVTYRVFLKKFEIKSSNFQLMILHVTDEMES